MAARADNGDPPRKDRVRATPFVAAVGGERVGPLLGVAGANDGSVDFRPGTVPAGGFFVVVDIVEIN